MTTLHPVGCTDDMRTAVEDALRPLPSGAVIEVACADLETRCDLAEWCLAAGHRIVDPFAHWSIEHLQVAKGT